MPAYSGNARLITIAVEESGGGPLTYLEIEAQTSTSVSSERESIETTTKNERHATSIPGIASGTLSLECMDMTPESGAPGQARLKLAYRNGERVWFREEEWDQIDKASLTPLQETWGYITSNEREMGLNEAGSFSMEAELQQLWMPIVAPVAP